MLGEQLQHGYLLRLSPLAFARWLGLLVTALNLLPIGQLDGGHMARPLFGHRIGKTISSVATWSLFLLAIFVWPGLMLWAIIVFFIAGRGTPPLNDTTPVSTGRRWIGYATFQMHIQIELLDIGGEGRYEIAWNLNPRSLKTLGPDKGVAIPRHILGRAECIPLPDRSVQQIIMERAPMRRAAVLEMIRVIVPGGTIILRHHAGSGHNPHVIAHQLIGADFSVQQITIGRQELQQTCFRNVRRVGMTGTTSNRYRHRTGAIVVANTGRRIAGHTPWQSMLVRRNCANE
ncbi:site-2 protease family protein [Stieleria sedimenti]|uniref:site-2 protease family protein n=1 Tax=Stieleria sedimenti TaxID=2976331 RepID=UPI0021802DCE|nr:site-2 protease family protein [Stieleria sedimenti]